HRHPTGIRAHLRFRNNGPLTSVAPFFALPCPTREHHSPIDFLAASVATASTIFTRTLPATGPILATSFLKRFAAIGVRGVSLVRSSNVFFSASFSSALNWSRSSVYSFAAESAISVHGKGVPHSSQ